MTRLAVVVLVVTKKEKMPTKDLIIMIGKIKTIIKTILIKTVITRATINVKESIEKKGTYKFFILLKF